MVLFQPNDLNPQHNLYKLNYFYFPSNFYFIAMQNILLLKVQNLTSLYCTLCTLNFLSISINLPSYIVYFLGLCRLLSFYLIYQFFFFLQMMWYIVYNDIQTHKKYNDTQFQNVQHFFFSPHTTHTCILTVVN